VLPHSCDFIPRQSFVLTKYHKIEELLLRLRRRDGAVTVFSVVGGNDHADS
jgi:hypothetical protein